MDALHFRFLFQLVWADGLALVCPGVFHHRMSSQLEAIGSQIDEMQKDTCTWTATDYNAQSRTCAIVI